MGAAQVPRYIYGYGKQIRTKSCVTGSLQSKVNFLFKQLSLIIVLTLNQSSLKYSESNAKGLCRDNWSAFDKLAESNFPSISPALCSHFLADPSCECITLACIQSWEGESVNY